jgi:hypothetical protein
MTESIAHFNQRAAREWSSRPDDERFESLEALREACELDTRLSQEVNGMNRRELAVIPRGADLSLVHERTGLEAAFSNWSFGQTCRLAGAPANYLANLPAPLAAQCVTHGLKTNDNGPAVLYLRGSQTGNLPRLRAFTSERYRRFLNLDLIDGLQTLQANGWIVPPGWNNRPSGLYYSDRSMFAYMIDDATRSIVTHPEATRREDLGRGFFLWNSEEGAESFGLCAFHFRYTCGNHLVWGVSAFTEIRLRHIGDRVRLRIRNSMRDATLAAARFAEQDAEAIRWAMGERLVAGALPARDRERVTVLAEAVRDRSRGDITVPMAARAIERAIEEGENERTVWGVVNGFTALARDAEYRDRAADLMRAPLAMLPRELRQRTKTLTV